MCVVTLCKGWDPSRTLGSTGSVFDKHCYLQVRGDGKPCVTWASLPNWCLLGSLSQLKCHYWDVNVALQEVFVGGGGVGVDSAGLWVSIRLVYYFQACPEVCASVNTVCVVEFKRYV